MVSNSEYDDFRELRDVFAVRSLPTADQLFFLQKILRPILDFRESCG